MLFRSHFKLGMPPRPGPVFLFFLTDQPVSVSQLVGLVLFLPSTSRSGPHAQRLFVVQIASTFCGPALLVWAPNGEELPCPLHSWPPSIVIHDIGGLRSVPYDDTARRHGCWGGRRAPPANVLRLSSINTRKNKRSMAPYLGSRPPHSSYRICFLAISVTLLLMEAWSKLAFFALW